MKDCPITINSYINGHHTVKYKLISTALFSVFLSACGGGGSSSSVAASTDGDTTNVDSSGDYTGVPYDYSQYVDALNNANLQQTDLTDCDDDDSDNYCSKSDVVDAGEYEDYDSEYFYIDTDSGWLTFEMEGDSNRTELRFTENFLSNLSDTTYSLTAEVLPISPSESVANSTDGEEITLLQVHNKGTSGETDSSVLSHPLLRIIWDGESRTDDNSGDSYSNAYWAIIKTNAYECSNEDGDNYNANCPDSYDFYYLSTYDSSEPTEFNIEVGNSTLTINVDGQEQVDFNIDYWSELYSYFKAGVYNQYTDGNSVVQFKTVTYSETIATESALQTNLLDPDLPPSDNFDLSTWNLSVPLDNGEGDGYAKATTITVEALNDGYELANYFWTDTTDGGMVFRDYIGGARTSEGTSYTRTEFREMLRGEETSIKTQGVNENNWVFSNAPEEQQDRAGGVDGNMVATLAVNHVTSTGDSSQQGRVIIGQIHAASDEPIRLYYRLLDGHDKGSIYFAHEPSNGNDEEWYEMIGSRSSSASEPSDGIELDEKFSYEIDVVGTLLTVSIMRDDKETITQEVDMADSGYDGYYTKDGEETEDYMYFKAGVYNQNNTGDTTDYVQATFYYLNKTH